MSVRRGTLWAWPPAGRGRDARLPAIEAGVTSAPAFNLTVRLQEQSPERGGRGWFSFLMSAQPTVHRGGPVPLSAPGTERGEYRVPSRTCPLPHGLGTRETLGSLTRPALTAGCLEACVHVCAQAPLLVFRLPGFALDLRLVCCGGASDGVTGAAGMLFQAGEGGFGRRGRAASVASESSG